MRRRRHIERTRGRAALRGTFDHVLAEAASEGIAPEEIQTLLSGLRIRPVITAHPTESKRVTVLEKYRKIYLLLRELEQSRWTERERTALIGDLRDQIELVWMTGELHLEKPTVQHEVVARAPLLRRGAVRQGAGDAGADRRRARALLPGAQFRAAPVLPVRLVDRRRPRRQSVGHHPRHRLDAAPERARRAAPLQHPHHRSCAGAVDHRARAAGAARLPGRACARAWRQRRGRRHQEAQSRRALPAISLHRAAQARRHHRPRRRAWISAAPARPISVPTS